MKIPKEIAEKILNCKTYTIPEIQELAHSYLELEKEHQKINCGYCGKEFDREWSELQEHIKVCELHPVFFLNLEIINFKAQIKSVTDYNEEILKKNYQLEQEVKELKQGKEISDQNNRKSFYRRKTWFEGCNWNPKRGE